MLAHRFRDSSMIDRVAFDDAAQTLCVSFKQTGKYLYYDVPEAVFAAMCRAKSAGQFFNEHVKGKFRCRRDPERRRFGPSAEHWAS
jgi:hypothetical protein